jgi:hypothetical protein
MRQREWASCTDAAKMLKHLATWGRGPHPRPEMASRKHHLFAVACCRRVWHNFDGRCRRIVEVVERFADAAAGEGERADAQMDARQRWVDYYRLSRAGAEDSDDPIDRRLAAARTEAAMASAYASCDVSGIRGEGAVGASDRARSVHAIDVAWDEDAYLRLAGGRRPVPGADDAFRAARAAEGAIHCDLIRDIFGPRPVISPSWLTAPVLRLAEALYEGRDFSAMGVLGDALEEAGCDDPGILGHCRSGVHARGCWLVDSILGKG